MRRHGWIVAACALTLHCAVLAQEQPDPAADPNLNDPSVDAKARDLERHKQPVPVPPAVTRPAAQPQADPVAGLQTGLTGAPLRREGTFLVRQRGSLVKTSGGQWAFVFHRVPQGQAERPMFLLRSQHLARMEQLAGQRPEEATFLISGQVFAYRGVNYLLVAPIPPVLAQPDSNAASADQPAGAPAEAPSAPPQTGDAEPTTHDLLRTLEAQRDRPRALGLPPAPESTAAPPDRKAILAEGTIINRRRGRLVRAAGGETAVMFDNDADSAAGVDPPLILLPCLTMERMETIGIDRGESLVFEISGRVFAYGGRNYLLPTMFQIYAPTDLERRQ